MAGEIDKMNGGDEVAEMLLLAAKNAALESAITDKDKTIAELKAEVQQLKSVAEKSSVSFEEKRPIRAIPTDIVEVKGVKYRSKRTAFWHGTQKVTASEFVKDKELFADLVAMYPSEFEEVD